MLDLEKIESGFSDRFPNRMFTIDSHTQGEPTRLIVGGLEKIPGDSMQAKRKYFISHLDSVRMSLTREPRGHRGIMAAVVTEPVSRDSQFGLIYMDARRYPYLCGHATIGAAASLIETGAIAAGEGESRIIVDTPSGPLHLLVNVKSGIVDSVSLEMVPSFVFKTGVEIEVPGFGRVPVDLTCVGGFFAMVSARSVGIELAPKNSLQLISLGMAIIEAANREVRVFHPERPEVRTVDVTAFYDREPGAAGGKSAVIYGESHMDRSPCGTGTTAIMTLLHHRGELETGRTYINCSPLGEAFEGCLVRTNKIGDFNGVVGRIKGRSNVTGFHQFVVDKTDPFPEGFIL
jgi:proline racemase